MLVKGKSRTIGTLEFECRGLANGFVEYPTLTEERSLSKFQYRPDEYFWETREMDLSTLTSFMFVASLLVMSPGPNGALLARTVPSSGRAAGFANVAGFVTAFYLHGTLSILGISAVLMHSAQAFLVVKLLGAVYLCWIGIKALRDAFRTNHGPVSQATNVNCRRALPFAFVDGFVTNAFNPKVSMFYLAAFPQFITPGDGAVWSASVLVIVHSLLAAAWFSAIIIAFSKLSGVARSECFQCWIKGVTGAVFIGFGVRLATLKP